MALYDDFGFPTDPGRRCPATTLAGQRCKMRAVRSGRVQHQSGEWVDMTWSGDRCSYHNGTAAFMSGWGKRVTDDAKKRELAVAFARNQQRAAERAGARPVQDDPDPAMSRPDERDPYEDGPIMRGDAGR